MGLDVSHDCWSGAYGAFSRWRDALAKAAGYEFAKIGDDRRETILIDWGHVVEKNYYGDWDELPHGLNGRVDYLLLLIAHADNEGIIPWAYCDPLADRLEELAPHLREDGEGHIDSYQGKTLRFAAGLRKAYAAQEDVEFS